jgi:hypothetical protein
MISSHSFKASAVSRLSADLRSARFKKENTRRSGFILRISSTKCLTLVIVQNRNF